MCKDQCGFTFKSNRGTSNSLRAANLTLPFAPPWSEKANDNSKSVVDQEEVKSKTIPTADKVCVCAHIQSYYVRGIILEAWAQEKLSVRSSNK